MRILKGRVRRADEKDATHALVENWGGVYSAVAYGSEDAMRSLQDRLEYRAALYPLCKRCGKVRVLECECGKERR